MVSINGKEFPIYVTDTVESIFNRVAATRNPPTLPKYLVFDPPIVHLNSFANNLVFKARDILSEIRYATSFELPRVDLPEDSALKLQDDIEKIFVVYNEYLNDADENSIRMLLMSMKGLTINPYDAWLKRQYITSTLEKAIEENKRAVEHHLSKILKFEGLEEVKTTPFDLVKIQLTFYFGQTSNSLYQFFDSIVLDKHVPFAQFNNYYKVYAGFVPQLEWTTAETDNVILIKINNEKNGNVRLLKDQYRKYVTAAFGIENSVMAVTTEVHTGRRFANRNLIQDRIERIFSFQNLDAERIVENSVVGYFVIPYQKLNTAVFAELTMNHDMFKELVVINESIMASKTKQNIYMHVIGSSETVSVQMNYTNKLFEIPGLDMPINTPYVRVRIAKSESVLSARNVQSLIAKLFTVYNDNYDSVVKQYKRFIPKFAVEVGAKRKVKEKKNVQLKDIAPDLFLPNYSRKCVYKPTIISDEEAATTKNAVMRFPVKGEGVERNYICEHELNQYPGLRENPLENKDVYPFIPCCYGIDQRKKEGSRYRQYFNDEKVPVDKAIQVQEILTTSKILHPTVIGILPKPIRNMFSAFTSNPDYVFMRKGINRSSSSIIEAVMVAKGMIKGPELDMAQRIDDQRTRLCRPEFAWAAKQELFDKPIESIMETIQKFEMRGSSFVHLIEQAFDVDIILFSKDKFLIPPHKHVYYKMKPSRQTVFVYEHLGSEADAAEFPQSELIIKASAVDVQKHTAIFSHNDPIVKGVFGKFHEYNSLYKFSTLLPPLVVKPLNFVSQRVDGFGKGRVYNVSMGNELVTIVSEPLPPYALPFTDVLYRVDADLALKFCKLNDLTVLRQRLEKGVVRELDIVIGSVDATLLVNDRKGKIPDVEVDPVKEKFERITDYKPSVIAQHVIDKRLSKLLFNYVKFVMSEYLFSNNIHEITSTVINDFVNKFVVIDKNVVYDLDDVSPKFTAKNAFTRGNKLVIQSEEMLKRLMFLLRLHLHTNKVDMLTFRKSVNIDDYFSDIDDFTQVKSQYLFDNVDAVRRLIENAEIKYTIVDGVLLDYRHPYFFQNQRVGSSAVYVAQNAPDYDTANAIVYGWRTKRLNVAIKGARQKVFIYNYTNSKDIREIQRGPSVSEIILGYKVAGIPRYTVILKI